MNIMSSFVILPTQLHPRPKSFWKQWKRVILIEDPHYINKQMHPLKVWMHRASMMEYFDAINHSSKKYVRYTESIDMGSDFTMCHPTDQHIVDKYRKGTFIDNPSFLIRIDELQSMDTNSHDVFYKKMRVKFEVLMKGSNPEGGRWSFDSENRKKYPTNYKEVNILDRSLKNRYINESSPVVKLSVIKVNPINMIWATNRKQAMKDLRHFIRERLTDFGPYQDAINQDVVVGYHSCISASLNIGLITPLDVIKEVMVYKIPIASLEGFIRQIIGWREYIRMKYVLHGLSDWSHLKKMNTTLPKSWYNATTGIETLDWSIKRVLRYSYASHIERLMLLANYSVLLRLKYKNVHEWFVRMFIDGYDWCMLNVSMGVNSLGGNNKFMMRAYLTNGTYLKKMGLKISKNDEDQLRRLYESFILDNKELARRDYRLAAAVKRLT